MKRMNTFRNEEPIRTPFVRLNPSTSSDHKTKGPAQDIPQMSYSLNVKEEEEDGFDTKGNNSSQTDSQYLSIPQVRVQTPPVQSLRSRSQSVPSIDNNILMEYYSVKSINKRANADLITFSSRHLSSHSPSEVSHSPNLHHNKFYERHKRLVVVNTAEKGHHSERESPNASASVSATGSFNTIDRPLIEKSNSTSNWIWSSIDDSHSKLYRNQIQNSHFQRPATPFETKGFRKSSVISLKEIGDDIEEIQMNTEKNRNTFDPREKACDNANSHSKFSKSFPFIKKLNFNRNEKSNDEKNSPETVNHKSFLGSSDTFFK